MWTACRSKIVSKSAFTHAVKPSRMNETSSRNLIISLRQGTAISDDRERDYAALGERNCTHVFWGRNGAPDISHKAEVPWVPDSFQVGASGSPTTCHEDFGDDGVSQGCSCVKLISSLLDCEGFADSVVKRLACKMSSPGSRLLFIINPLPSRYAFWNVSKTVSTGISILSSR